MSAISHTTFSNAFAWMKCFVFLFKFHWSLLLWVQSTISQHWFKQWLGADQATSHYLNQCWPSSQAHICGTRGIWVKDHIPVTDFIKEVNTKSLFQYIDHLSTYMDYHYKDKTVTRPSYFYGIPILARWHLYTEMTVRLSNHHARQFLNIRGHRGGDYDSSSHDISVFLFFLSEGLHMTCMIIYIHVKIAIIGHNISVASNKTGT